MLKRMLAISVVVLMITIGVLGTSAQVYAGDVPRMSAEQLKRSLGNDNLVIVDARSGSDWRGSELKIKGAIRGKAGDEDEWAVDIPKDAEIVIYCA